MPQKFDSLERSDRRFKREFKDVQHHKEAKIMQSVSRTVFIEMRVAGQCQGSGAIRRICDGTRRGEQPR